MEKITQLADRCALTDYSDPASLKAHNGTADRIRELIATITKDEEYFALLRGEQTKGWAAFQLLEHSENLSATLCDAACAVLREIATSSSPEGLAAKWRLKELGRES